MNLIRLPSGAFLALDQIVYADAYTGDGLRVELAGGHAVTLVGDDAQRVRRLLGELAANGHGPERVPQPDFEAGCVACPECGEPCELLRGVWYCGCCDSQWRPTS